MTVVEAIKQLQAIESAGYGDATLRSYNSLSCEVYPPVSFTLHHDKDNEDTYDPSYGTWVEVV
jgi:hypothetical protein